MRRYWTALVGASVLAAAGLTLAGCTSGPDPEPTPTETISHLEGTWRSLEGVEFLEFDEDGTFVGFDNCNTVEGAWASTADGVRLQFLGGTEKGCPEGSVWLITAEAAAQAEDGSLELRNGGGEVVGTLTRQEP